MSSALVNHVGFSESLSITISLCLTYTLLIVGIRLYIRSSNYGADDACVLGATVSEMSPSTYLFPREID